jgi:hypothetical protein
MILMTERKKKGQSKKETEQKRDRAKKKQSKKETEQKKKREKK